MIKANDDLTPEHHQFFLYQMLRGLKYIHSAKVGPGVGWASCTAAMLPTLRAAPKLAWVQAPLWSGSDWRHSMKAPHACRFR